LACFHPIIPEGLACASDGSCPGDQTCGLDRRCHIGPAPKSDSECQLPLSLPAGALGATPPSIAAGDGLFALAWASASRIQVFDSRNCASTMLDTPGELLDPPSFAYAAGLYGVAWGDAAGVWLATYSNGFGPPQRAALELSVSSPALVATEDRFAVAYQRNDTVAVLLSGLDRSGALLFSNNVSTMGESATFPAVAAFPDGFAVVYNREALQSEVIHAVLTRDGIELVATVTATLPGFGLPRVAAAAGRLCVVWIDQSDLTVRIRSVLPIGDDGSLPLLLGAGARGTAGLVSTGALCAVAWAGVSLFGDDADGVHLAYFDPGTSKLVNAPLLLAGDRTATSPSLGFDGRQVIAAWQLLASEGSRIETVGSVPP
jgi:hypothetical protein